MRTGWDDGSFFIKLNWADPVLIFASADDRMIFVKPLMRKAGCLSIQFIFLADLNDWAHSHGMSKTRKIYLTARARARPPPICFFTGEKVCIFVLVVTLDSRRGATLVLRIKIIGKRAGGGRATQPSSLSCARSAIICSDSQFALT